MQPSPANPSPEPQAVTVIDRPRTRIMVTPAQREMFIEQIEKQGTFQGAIAAMAQALGLPPRTDSGHLTRSRTWYELRKRDLSFDAACTEAELKVKGRIEASIFEASQTPDTRPIFHPKTGELLGEAKAFFSANQLKLRIAEKLETGSWVQQKNIKGTLTHNHNDGKLPGGAAYIFTHEMLDLLSLEDRQTLLEIASRAEDKRLELQSAKTQSQPQMQLEDQR